MYDNIIARAKYLVKCLDKNCISDSPLDSEIRVSRMTARVGNQKDISILGVKKKRYPKHKLDAA